MPNLSLDQRYLFRRVTITNAISSVGARMGGASPDVDLSLVKDGYKYFFTIPSSKADELSVFIEDDFDKYWDNKGILQRNSMGGMVHLLSHEKSTRRSSATSHCNYLSPLSLAISAQSADVANSADAWHHHKLSGYPYSDDKKISHVVNVLMKSGHSLVMQLAFPGPDDCDVNLNWPFSDGFFYIFSKGSSFSFLWT